MIKACGLAAILGTIALAGVVDATERSAGPLAGDLRVQDAVRAWTLWVEYQAALQRVPSVTLALVHDQELIANQAFGLADVEARRPATVSTMYSICSISKLFTSVAVMQQRDAGRLRLDDPLASYLPWLALRDVHPDDEAATLRGVLTHSAGLPRDADFPYWTDDGYPFPSREAMIERLSAQETLYPASRYFQYSNLGMVLAAEVVTAVTGKGFDATVRDGIVLPLGMQDTFTDVPDARRSGRLATGYSALRRDGTRKPLQSFDTRSVAPAAGLVSTAGDLARFAMWQNRLLGGQSDAVLRASTLREMQRVQWVDPDWGTMRGLGFGIWREGSRTLVGHSGGCAGYYSQFLLEPESHIAVAVLANAINADVWAYATQAYALVGPAVASAVAASEASSPDRSPALDRYAGIYETEWGQIAVLQWEDGLALLPLDTRSPADALVGLKLVDEHLFRVVRKDDPDVLGEVVAFEMNDRIATSFKWHSSRYSRAGP